MPCKRDVGQYLKKLGDTMEQYANRQLQSRNLTFSQSKLLMILGDKDDHTAAMKELESIFHSAQSTVSGLVARMEKKGLVRCSSAASDKRIKYVTLTESGSLLREQCVQDILSSNEWLVSSLSDAERIQLLNMLDRIYHTVTQETSPNSEPFAYPQEMLHQSQKG